MTLPSQRPDPIKFLLPLPPEARIVAIERAKTIVVQRIGKKPELVDFITEATTTFPSWFNRVILGLVVVVFLAAATVSLFRVFTAGRDHFQQSIDEPNQAAAVGLATFMLAEFAAITATLAIRALFKGRERWLLAVPIIIGVLIAIINNWSVTDPLADTYTIIDDTTHLEVEVIREDVDKALAILDTLGPPIIVLFTALILERVLLTALEERHSVQVLFKEAVEKWKIDTAYPEQHELWMNTLATCLRHALVQFNSHGSGATARKNYMPTMTDEEWFPVVNREMQADIWYTVPTETKPELPAPTITFPEITHPSTNGAKEPEQESEVTFPAPNLRPRELEDLTADEVLKFRPDLVRAILSTNHQDPSELAANYYDYLDETLQLLNSDPTEISRTRLWHLKKKLERVLEQRGFDTQTQTVTFTVSDSTLIQTWIGLSPLYDLTRPQVQQRTKEADIEQ